MKPLVALLRAVNVGGTGKLPMADLRAMCEEAGFERVRTYIASGNVVFRTDDAPERARSILETRLEDYAGSHIDVLVRTGREMADLVAANPFPDEPGNRVVCLFLDRHPRKDLDGVASGVADERFVAADREVFIHYPEGQGPSKLKLDLGVATARNMNTVRKLADMAAEL